MLESGFLSMQARAGRARARPELGLLSMQLAVLLGTLVWPRATLGNHMRLGHPVQPLQSPLAQLYGSLDNPSAPPCRGLLITLQPIQAILIMCPLQPYRVPTSCHTILLSCCV